MQQQLKSMIFIAYSSLRGGARASSEPAQRNTELRDDWTRLVFTYKLCAHNMGENKVVGKNLSN